MHKLVLQMRGVICFKCPAFPSKITQLIQNGFLFFFSVKLIYQVVMAILPLFINIYFPYYRIFEPLSFLLLAIGSRFFLKYRPKYGYIFTGAMGIVTMIVFFECSMLYYGGESGVQFFMIYNASTLVLIDFFKYYWIMLLFQIFITLYTHLRSIPYLLTPELYSLSALLLNIARSITLYSILFYILITIFNLITVEHIKKNKALENWKSMMEFMPIGIIITNENTVLFHNTFAADLLTKANITVSLQSIKDMLSNCNCIEKTKASKTIECNSVYISYQIKPIDFDGMPANLTILNDLSYLYQAQQQKEEQHTLEMFVATSTHELRTPLHIIKNTLEMMLDGPNTGQTEFIYKSLNACEMQECYINDILDYAKMNAGKLVLNIEPYNIKDMLTEIYGYFSALATEAQLSFDIDCPFSSLIVPIDYLRFKQILFNLISNALKFTMKGGIKLRVYQLEGKVNLDVMDTGIGMTEAEVNHLFKAFGVIESTRSLNKSGTGLGLFLCKMLTKLMDSEISVKSVKNAGTTFSLALKSLPSSTPYKVKSKPKHFRKYTKGECGICTSQKILIVDDNNFNCQILERMLSSLGVSSYKALNGNRAMEYIETQNDIKLALLDLHMPIMDGYELLKLIQQYYKSKGNDVIKVYALTGDSTEDVKLKCKEAGFNGFLSKPFSRDALVDIISQG